MLRPIVMSLCYTNMCQLLLQKALFYQMKLLYHYQQEAKDRVKRLYLQTCENTEDLISALAQRMNLNESQIILSYYMDSIPTRVIKGWPISHYGIEDGSLIYVNYVNQHKIANHLKFQQWISMRANNQTRQPPNSCLEKCLEEFLAYAMRGNYQEMKRLYATPCSTIENQQDILQRQRFLINQIGVQGWGAIHYSIFYGFFSVFEFLYINGLNVNIKTYDGWTPLMLAIEKQNIKIIKKLLQHKDIRVNQITSRGSALHISARKQNAEIINLLLENGANQQVKDENDRLPIQLCQSQKCKELLKGGKLIKSRTKEVPPIVKGYLCQVKRIFSLVVQRFVVLNPAEGSLKIFDGIQDFPNHPKQSIKLSEVKSISIIGEHEKCWWMKKDYLYFRISRLNKVLTFCSKIHNIGIKWMKSIADSTNFFNQFNPNEHLEHCAFSLFLDHKISKITVISNRNVQQKKVQTPIEVNFSSFQFKHLLGSGAFAQVFLATLRSNGKNFAVKVLNKTNLMQSDQIRYAESQVNILRTLNHPFIVQLHFSFQSPGYLYMALEYCPNGDLSDLITRKGRFSEAEAKIMIAQIILAIEHLHSKNIIYRDMKPENILIDQHGYFKLADFGLSKQNVREDYATTFCGSPVYISPQMLENQYSSKQSDIYGMGCILFEALDGFPPFYNNNINKLYESIKQGKYTLPKGLRPETKSLISAMLHKDPNSRIKISQMKCHSFFKDFDWSKMLSKKYQSIVLPTKKQFETAETLDFTDGSTEMFNDQRRVANYTFNR